MQAREIMAMEDALCTVEAESAPAGISLVWSYVLGRGSLPLHPELPPVVHSIHERLTLRLDLLLDSTLYGTSQIPV
jgi:hypothetical protein